MSFWDSMIALPWVLEISAHHDTVVGVLPARVMGTPFLPEMVSSLAEVATVRPFT